MVSQQASPRQSRSGPRLMAAALALLLIGPALAQAQDAKLDILRIGTSGTLSSGAGAKEKSALETLRSFIKEETGYESKILRQKDWRELADKMAKKELQLGVFQGYEFAWAQEKYPKLKPLALAVNVYRYPIAYVVTKRDNSAKDFAGLKGQSLSLPATGQRYLRLFVDRQSQVAGKGPKAFFAKITTPENVEDALDDVVDGDVQATVADRAALEGYKRRKPGRFKQLKEVAKSQPFPPTVIVYYDSVLDEATRQHFQEGLLRAGRTDRGETMLTLFRLSGFEGPPADFGSVLAQTRKTYPPLDAGAK